VIPEGFQSLSTGHQEVLVIVNYSCQPLSWVQGESIEYPNQWPMLGHQKWEADDPRKKDADKVLQVMSWARRPVAHVDKEPVVCTGSE
jgi:hypothetical protein